MTFLFGCGGSDDPRALPVNLGTETATASCTDASCAPVLRCLPRHCVFLECGLSSDGCGGEMDCGVCSNGLECGSGGVPNQCPQRGAPTHELRRGREQ